MKANRMWLFSDVLEKNKRVFKVPVYQRNYDWTNIQCEKLFQDIMKAGENNRQHFTGTVVYIDDVNGGSGLNEVLIIDGQQRITTMYILLKALYDASKGVSARIEDEVQEVMFNRHCDEKYKVKLKPVKKEAEPAAKPEKKSSRGKKAEAKVTAPVADKTEEEKLDQNLFDEKPEKQATEIDIDDLLG